MGGIQVPRPDWTNDMCRAHTVEASAFQSAELFLILRLIHSTVSIADKMEEMTRTENIKPSMSGCKN